MSDYNANHTTGPDTGGNAAPSEPQAAQPQATQPQATQPQATTPLGQQPYYQQGAYQNQQQGAYQQPYVAAQTQHAASAGAAGAKKPSGATARTFGIAFAGAALACVLGLGGFGIYQAVTGSGSGTTTTLGATTNTDIQAESTDSTLAEAVAEKALPSVAAIDVYTSQSSSGSMYGYGYGSGSSSGSSSLTQSSLGSGVVLSADGYIITNYHVIEGADALKVTVNGAEYDADVVGSDPSSDIAVIKARDASDLEPIELGDSDNLTIGEWVMSIGSPFGLEQSVATGIVSATSRSQIINSSTDSYGNSTGEYTIYPNMIQTDAAINPGNSGGALVDEDGKLIGINTLITSYSGNYSGVGFAIPVNYAVNIAQQIIEGETPTHAQLGVSLTTVNSQTAKRYGLAVESGAYISSVYSGSGAEEAGIQQGDIVTAFNGEKVESASDLMIDIRALDPGDTATVTVNRKGQSIDIEVTLGSDESSQSSSSSQQNGSSGSMLERLLGNGSSSGSSQGASA